MQKAKRRTNAMPALDGAQNGSGVHKNDTWKPGDPPELHPLFSSFGAFKDDPFWDEFVQAMDDERRKIDERYPIEDDKSPAIQEDKQNVRT